MRFATIVSISAYIFVAGNIAHAGADNYICTIREHLNLEAKGLISRPPKPHLIGETFAIDRVSGKLIGPDKELWSTRTSTHSVLAKGNSDNSFWVLITDPAYNAGVHMTVIQVQEFASGSNKPFVALSSGTVASGTCR